MQPTLDVFREAVERYRGNLTKVAKAFGVTRTTVANWRNTDEEWRQVVHDARLKLYDDCLATAEVTALGIPARDDDGRLVGWIEKPDSQMLRYFLSSLGREDGFGDTLETVQDKPLDSVLPRKIAVEVVYNSTADLELQEKAAAIAMGRGAEEQGETQKQQ